MLNRTTLACVAALTVSGSLLAACSGGSSGAGSTPASQPGATTAGSGAPSTATSEGGTADAGAVSDVNLRIANLYETTALAAGPGLDLYDTPLTGQAAKPLLTDVAYGSFSAYVHPHSVISGGTKAVQLYVLPTGEDPVASKVDAVNIGGVEDDGSGVQVTLLLAHDIGGVELPGALPSLSFSTFVEKGDDGSGGRKGPIAPAPPGGDGELLASTTVLDDERIPGGGGYLMIDDSCAEPLNHDPNSTGLPEIFAASSAEFNTPFALFPVTPGTHEVSVATWTGSATPTCAQLTAKQGQTSVAATGGQQNLVFVYGTSATDLHLAVGPIQP